MTKHVCVYCGEIFDEDKVVMVGIHSGWKFPTSTIMCNSCFENWKKSEQACSDCKYWKNPMKFHLFLTEPCKSCKNHGNWESKLTCKGK